MEGCAGTGVALARAGAEEEEGSATGCGAGASAATAAASAGAAPSVSGVAATRAVVLAGSASSAWSVAPARLERPRRCTLPITALRVIPPSSLAIWLALLPSAHIVRSVSTRSSVHVMGQTRSFYGEAVPRPRPGLIVSVSPMVTSFHAAEWRRRDAGRLHERAGEGCGDPAGDGRAEIRTLQLARPLDADIARGAAVHQCLVADAGGARRDRIPLHDRIHARTRRGTSAGGRRAVLAFPGSGHPDDDRDPEQFRQHLELAPDL